MSGSRIRYAGLAAAWLAGLVCVAIGDRVLGESFALLPLSLTTGYVAVVLVRAGRAAIPVAVAAVPVTILAWTAGATDVPAAITGASGAALGGVVAGVMLRATGVTMTRPAHPALVALAAAVGGGVAAAGAVATTVFDPELGMRLAVTWSAAALGTILLVPFALTFRPRRRGLVHHPAEFVAVSIAAVAVLVVAARAQIIPVAPGFFAWLLLPLLLAAGLRYGLFAAAQSLLIGGLLTALGSANSAALRADTTLLEQRQIVVALLAVVLLTFLLLLREQRAGLARERASQEVMSAFLRHSDSMWYVKDVAGGAASPLTYLRLGGGPFRDRDYSAPVTDDELFGPESAAQITAADHEVLSSGTGSAVLEPLTTPVGKKWTTLSNRFPVRDADGTIIALGGIRTDVTEREEVARLREEQARLLETVFVRSPVPSLRAYSDETGSVRVSAVNDALGRVIGRDPATMVDTEIRELVVEEDWPTLAALLSPAPAPRHPERWSPQAEVRIHTRIGQHRRALVTVAPLDARSQREREYLIHVEDVTARRAAEEAVAWYSLFDAVTGLLNRTAMSDRLDAALHRLGDANPGIALITLDVDDFKSVNDSHGHGAGDLVLVEFGTRIQRVCDSRNSVARLSADEFAVLVEWEARESVAVFVGRLQSALAEPVLIGEEPVSCTVSFGVALTKDPGISAGELVRQSELALFRAKRLGRGRVAFYAESMRVHAQAVLNVRNELTQAVAQDGFAVAYQPIVELDDGAVVGFEALVRLPTQDGRILSPADFLDVARSADLVTQIDRLVLREALADLAGQRLPVGGCGLSVNVEPDDLRDPDFAMRVLTQLHAFSVAPELLTVEVTEAALLPYDEWVLANMASLRDAGIRFAIDDFGTGYSSLAQLRRLDVDVIKIDRSFVAAMEHDPEDANIVATVVGLAHRLGLVAVAEGIETREQAEALQRLGCDRGQGFLFGHPMTIAPKDRPIRPAAPADTAPADPPSGGD